MRTTAQLAGASRLLGAACLLLTVAGCPSAPAPAAPTTGSQASRCGQGAADACERAMLVAPGATLPSLLEAYARIDGRQGWLALYRAMRKHREQAMALGGVGQAAGSTVRLLERPLPTTPESVPLERLLLALGRAAGATHLLVRRGARIEHLFPNDALAPYLLALPAILAADPKQLPAEIDAARAIRAALQAAGKSDYLVVASEADHLRAIRSALRPDSEVALRLRRALAMLDTAGLSLSVRDKADAAQPASDKPPPLPDRTSSAYADLLVVQLSRPDPTVQWRRHRARIVRGLSADRATLLDNIYGKQESCPSSVAPPMDNTGDLLFANSLAHALDEGSNLGQPAARGQLPLAQWLPRYTALVDRTARSGAAWSLLGSLLAQRGELGGLSAEGTTTYAKVTAMGLAHVAALTKLAEAHPARVKTLGVVALAYPRGVLGDRRLRDAVRALLRKSVALEIEAARQPAGVFEAAAAAFAASTSYPTAMQAAQLEGLRQALGKKLDGPFGEQTGWALAGLHGVRALLDLFTKRQANLERAGRRIASALSADGLAQPALARLANAAARYSVLAAADGLDAKIANPAMFRTDRRRAQLALGAAIAGLSNTPPTSSADRELLAELTGLLDGLIAALAARLGNNSSKTVRCRSSGTIGPDDPLRDAYDRLRTRRHRLLALAAFKAPESSWSKRARLLGLLASDALDAADQRAGKLELAVAEPLAERIAHSALGGWLEGDVADLLTGSYLFGRSVLAGDGDGRRAAPHAAQALAALSRLFDEHSGAAHSLFSALSKLGASSSLVADFSKLSRVFVERAATAYRQNSPQRGDVMLMLVLGVAIARDRAVSAEAIRLAKDHARPVYLPLVMHAQRLHDSGDPSEFSAALRTAVRHRCVAPDPAAVIAVRQAIFDFRQGRRKQALEQLEQVLADAERSGIDVPRQIYRYRQVAGDKVFSVEQSLSMGGNLLRHAGSLQLGFGLQTIGTSGGELRVDFADAHGREATREAARYYAHTAGLTAIYQFAAGHDRAALVAARHAVDAWANGVRLGERRIPVGGDTKTWAADARAVIALAAQLGAERGMPLLAGDLWTLLLMTFDEDADDEAVASVLEPLPHALRDIAELTPVIARAKATLRTATAKLSCTSGSAGAASLARVDCRHYPIALSLRVADAIPTLPRLRGGAEIGKPSCQPWRKLDAFLAAASERRYEPDKLTAAVAALAQGDHANAAATLLTRQRHADHCSPALVRQARLLSGHRELGTRVRADLLGVAVNCDPSPSLDADLVALDDLTAVQPMPTRNFEVLAYATRLALDAGRYGPLQAITSKPHFMKRWLQIGPDLATAALLVQHAAVVGAGKPPRFERSLPFYRLLCTTFPPKHRGPMCDTIAMLRGSGSHQDKQHAAELALRRFLAQATAAVRP